MRESRKSCQNAMLLFVSKVVVIIHLIYFFFFSWMTKRCCWCFSLKYLAPSGNQGAVIYCSFWFGVRHINNRGSEEVLTDGIKNSNVFFFFASELFARQ